MAAIRTLTDQALISLLRDGSEAAFNEIHERYFQDLFRSAYNILRECDPCMDIVQEVLVWFWENRERHQINTVKGYLLAAVKYQVSNYIRSSKIRENFRLQSIQADHTLNEESLELQELRSVIEIFTANLPDKCREIFKMSREQHLSNKEIAVILHISEKTVSAQIARALQKLRKELGRMHFWLCFFV